MTRHWTFGQRIGGGFAVTVVLAATIGAVAVFALRGVVAAKDQLIDRETRQIGDVRRLETLAERKSSEGRGYLLVRDDRLLANVRATRAQFSATVDRVRQTLDARQTPLLDVIARAEEEHQRALEQVFTMRRGDAALDAVVRAFDDQVLPPREQLTGAINSLLAATEATLQDAQAASTATASQAQWTVTTVTIVLIVVASVAAYLLTRLLGRQIGSAVGQVQSSSSELQAAANQQATGAREQATAMSEISTTISELLATSRQITESAQRVAQIAEETARSAGTGQQTVEQTHESVSGIRRQVDLIVTHMLELGRKSQHIGGVLDIVSELAEQTNILAINATIEAAGAGDAGRRFAIVADEIRKLADRVGASTKEIRGLIDDVRSAVNTTVMATEAGSKSVETGSRHFDHVAASFKQIAGLVTATTEAAREIELSTKQQTTAVEQVNVAITNIAQASKETEASSTQTLQTASQLAGLSKDLQRLVESQRAA